MYETRHNTRRQPDRSRPVYANWVGRTRHPSDLDANDSSDVRINH